jgi:hypothetical protein
VYISGSPAASGQPVPAKALIDFLAAPMPGTSISSLIGLYADLGFAALAFTDRRKPRNELLAGQIIG